MTSARSKPSTPHDQEGKAEPTTAAGSGSPLNKYFLVALLGISVPLLLLNHNFVLVVQHHQNHHPSSAAESNNNNALQKSLTGFKTSNKNQLLIQQMIAETRTKRQQHNRLGERNTASATATATAVPSFLDNNNNKRGANDDGDAELHDPIGIHEQRVNDDDDGDADDTKSGSGSGNDNDNDDGDAELHDPNEIPRKQVDDDAPNTEHEHQGFGGAGKQQQQYQQQQQHTIANLNCDAYGGPSAKNAEEMVYWEDIPKDALHLSPFHADHHLNKQQQQPITQFLTFESDGGGWNNIRMAMETVFALAFAMGRTLVLPPEQGMYLIDKTAGTQQNKFSYAHFFHTESIHNEHVGLNIITTREFLERCAEGNIIDVDGKPIYPPSMRTNWDGAPLNEQKQLREWIRNHSGKNLLDWNPDRCIAAFPASRLEQDTVDLEALPSLILQRVRGFPQYQDYIGKPNPIDAPAIDRLAEMNADRQKLCTYTPELQQQQWLHFPAGMKSNGEDDDDDGSRLLVHFYAFLFFQDWKHDLWMKRFVRDHVRYIDAIQCAAARVVTALRKRVSDRTHGATTDFDTIHVRRGDFQFEETRVSATEILEQLQKVLRQQTTLYIATDETKRSFFEPIVDHFADVVFLDDLLGELEGVNTNYYGMIDQLVASRGNNFFGCWYSTFTGYINRLRGYHADDHELPGYEQGIIPSYYYAEAKRFDHMRQYWPIKQAFFAREFPASWRLIDASV